MKEQSNKELKLAFDFITESNRHMFLTGRAGTGKTTFLHQLKRTCPKRIAIAAPTGVAAINAGGVTLHSLFQLPFGPIIPTPRGQKNEILDSIHFRKNKIKLLQSLDLLVIDEISMVRPDILDAIDSILRRFRDSKKLFGGVQLLMIGDLYQLPPVIKNNEWKILSPYYETVYFFSSKAYIESNPVQIELQEVFRQTNQDFINLLEKVRNSGLNQHTKDILNSRYVPDLNIDELDGYIILTTHNAQADNINKDKLDDISGKKMSYDAIIDGIFSEYSYPCFSKLELKVGAQIMFVKNDDSYDKQFYNGKIGVISDLGENYIKVSCKGEEDEIEVGRMEWKNIKYSLNESSKKVEEEELGSFVQYPLKLAWAITIHKSQGLSFDKLVVDAGAAFAHGQVYVALSRCRSLEGLLLNSKIHEHSIKVDQIINTFTEEIQIQQPNDKDLEKSKHEFQRSQLLDIFNFDIIERKLFKLHSIISSAASTLSPTLSKKISSLRTDSDKKIFTVSRSFQNQLNNLSMANVLPEKNIELNERIKAAAIYFDSKLYKHIHQFTIEADIDADNKVLRKELKERIEEIQKLVFIKMKCFDLLKVEYKSLKLLHAKTNAELDFIFEKKKAVTYTENDLESKHPMLYEQLKQWRNDTAEMLGKSRYLVLANRVLTSISNNLPNSVDALKSIKGIGKKKIDLYSKDIFSIIAKYCKTAEITIEETKNDKIPEVKSKVASSEQSYLLFSEGKTLDEIASLRSMAVSTIVKHLELYVGSGQINISELVSTDKIIVIRECAKKNDFQTLSEMKAVLGKEYSYEEIRLVLRSMDNL